jgi:hypothetical protein
MGKSNAFFTIYGKLTGQDLGQDETAGDNVPDGDQEDGGGIASADDENAPKFSKADIQKMLSGEFPAEPSEDPNGLSDEPSAPLKGGMPDRTKIGLPTPVGSKADQIIRAIYRKAHVDPNSKMSKQNPIRIDSDEIIDIYNTAKTLPPEEKEKVIAFLKSGIVLPMKEGKIYRSQILSLVERIVEGVVKEVETAKTKIQEKKRWTVKLEKEQSGASAAGPVNGKKDSDQEKPLEEMTTTSGGGGSSAGTPGYNIPGAWAGGSLEKNKKHIEVLGYTLTPTGKKDMERAGDNLYENTEKTKKCQNCGETMGADKTRCPKCKFLNGDVPNEKEKELKYGALQEESGLGASFDRAQRNYDNQLPPDDGTGVDDEEGDDNGDGIECPTCGKHQGYVTDKGHQGSAYWIEMKCNACNAEWGHDNFDSLDDR